MQVLRCIVCGCQSPLHSFHVPDTCANASDTAADAIFVTSSDSSSDSGTNPGTNYVFNACTNPVSNSVSNGAGDILSDSASDT
jgi:hypothetical protein